jgi:hypothetical protein
LCHFTHWPLADVLELALEDLPAWLEAARTVARSIVPTEL